MAEGVEFVDETTVYARGGDGGAGVVSFRREKHVPRGGPNGGDGGWGGNVVFLADRNVSSLLDLHRNPHRRAEPGGRGQGGLRTGKAGQDKLIRVPLGTVVRDANTGLVLFDLAHEGQQALVVRGGRRGRGNASFANRYRRLPYFAEEGEQAKDRKLKLELKLIADVGLVGYPSAGKSSLIAHLSAAKPKIAAYPFTTLTPNLGVIRAGSTDFVMADVPGLIEGASDGKGLGHQFLRHIERCSALLHVVDTFPMEPDRDPIRDLDALLVELERHDPTLLERPQLVALNKVDLPDGQAMADLVREEIEGRGYEVHEISATSGQGLELLAYRLGEIVAEARNAVEIEVETGDVELVIRFDEEKKDFRVEIEDGRYHVIGERVYRWVQMLPLDNSEAMLYLQGRLRRAGVDRALVAAGARHGDEVVIDGAIFNFTPELDDLPKEERDAILAGELDDEDDGVDLSDPEVVAELLSDDV